LSNTLTGRFTDQTMWYLAIGIVGFVGGLLVLLFGRRGA
jgi:LPXTG-motif cell wall-anchored protein